MPHTRKSGQALAAPQTQYSPPRLYALVDEQLVRLSQLGSPTQCPEVAQQLCQALSLQQTESPRIRLPGLPSHWRVRRDAGAVLVLERSSLETQLQTGTLMAYAIACAVVLIALLRDVASTPQDPALIVYAALIAMTGAALWWDTSKRQWHQEWWITRGTCSLRQRRGKRIETVAHAIGFELTYELGHGGWYCLRAQTENEAGQQRSMIMLSVTDSSLEPRCLGLWLADKSSLPLYDTESGLPQYPRERRATGRNRA